MKINNRLAELEQITARQNEDFEEGAWLTFEYEDGTYGIKSARLGDYNFDTKEEMQNFINENHKGNPEGYIGFIDISYLDVQGEPPKEL
jgi:hypothetical protein